MAKGKIYVIPVAGLAVVKPGNRAMADRMIRPEGEYVPAVSYYLRAVRDGAQTISLSRYNARSAFPPCAPKKTT